MGLEDKINVGQMLVEKFVKDRQYKILKSMLVLNTYPATAEIVQVCLSHLGA